MKTSKSFAKLLFALFCFLIKSFVECKLPPVLDANIGDSIIFNCKDENANLICYSSYTFKNKSHSMIALNNPSKYIKENGRVKILDVNENDSGFYACSNDCLSINPNQISNYLQPMLNGEPIKRKSINPIPALNENLNEYVIYNDQSEEDKSFNKSADDSRNKLYVGLAVFFIMMVFITFFSVVFLIFYKRKGKSQNTELQPLQSEGAGYTKQTFVDSEPIKEKQLQKPSEETVDEKKTDKSNIYTDKKKINLDETNEGQFDSDEQDLFKKEDVVGHSGFFNTKNMDRSQSLNENEKKHDLQVEKEKSDKRLIENKVKSDGNLIEMSKLEEASKPITPSSNDEKLLVEPNDEDLKKVEASGKTGFVTTRNIDQVSLTHDDTLSLSNQ